MFFPNISVMGFHYKRLSQHARLGRQPGWECRGKIGTLAPGSAADVAVFRRIERQSRHLDTQGDLFMANQLLVPQMTVLNGKIVYRQIDFGTL